MCDSLNIIFKKNEINVLVEVPLDTSTCVTWNTITDYDNLEKFHSTLKKSEIRAVKGNEITIYQVFKTYLFGFPINFKNLFLVNETPNRFTLEISQIEGEFKKYHSIWKIEKKNITLLKINTSITLSNLEKIFISKKMLITQYKKFVGDLKKQLKHQKYEKMCSN